MVGYHTASINTKAQGPCILPINVTHTQFTFILSLSHHQSLTIVSYLTLITSSRDIHALIHLFRMDICLQVHSHNAAATVKDAPPQTKLTF